MKKASFFTTLIFLLSVDTAILFAHCDTMEGPVVSDAIKAMEQSNVNYVLKWIPEENEKEIKDAFDRVMKVRALSPEAKELSEKYFFETLVRVHRSGEGVAFTGVKPYGSFIDKKILAADKSLETGTLEPLEGLVDKDKLPELKKRFQKALSLKNFDVNNVAKGREYIEAYVQFFHLAEGEEEAHHHGTIGHEGHMGHLPWVLSGIFLFTTILFGILFYRKG